jgi:hypothetical protein
MSIYNTMSTGTSATSNYGYATGGIITTGTTGTTYATTDGTADYVQVIEEIRNSFKLNSGVEIKKIGDGALLNMPDGSIITIDKQGNFDINDKDSKVIYKANPNRDFNRYINASDLLEEFIRFLGKEFDIRQNQIMDVPINVFIDWLIVQAAMKDGDDYSNDMKMLTSEAIREKNWYRRCKCCGRYIQKKMFEAGLLFCNSICFNKYQLQL